MNIRTEPQYKRVTIYADGSCSGNPGVGGWCAILVYGINKKKIGGRWDTITTNNKMELQAVIEGLKALKEKCRVTVITDSKYVVDGMNIHMSTWLASNWKNNTIKNIDLWIVLNSYKSKHLVEFYWVRGHSGDSLNEECNTTAQRMSGAIS
jgi:ribonuclease HI